MTPDVSRRAAAAYIAIKLRDPVDAERVDLDFAASSGKTRF